MSNHRKGRVELLIHSEIVDWFIQLVNEKCGSGLHIQPKPNNGHFTTPVEIEIGGDEAQLDKAMDFIQNTSEITRCKMPWLNDYTYFVEFPEQKEWIEENLINMKATNYALKYNCTTLKIIGSSFYLFHFQSGLDDEEKLKIDEMFKLLIRNRNSIFLQYPHEMVNQPQSALDIHILTAFHGKFLVYLDLEDILSLEMANTRSNNLFWNEDLDHDIQQFLRENYSYYYTRDKEYHMNFGEFRSNEVLRYSIKKFHKSITKWAISNILPADEIRTLSHLYNIQFNYHDIIHIDFKGINEKVNFCAIYHHEPTPATILYYGSKYATQNYSVNFNVDGSLDSVNECTEFVELIVKSETNSPPLQTNAILKYVAENFMVGQFPNALSQLTLYEFDLNLVPANILRSLMGMMREGQLIFEKMNFNLNTFITILGQSDGDCIELKRCQINITNNMEEFPYHSKTRVLRFYDMNLELNAITILKNVEWLDIFGCRIHNNLPRLERPPNEIKQCAYDISINSCTFSLGDSDEPWHFTVGHNLWFENSEIKLKTIFQILENCKIQKQITFDNCHLRFEHEPFEHFSPKPVELIFKNTTVDSFAMHTILGKLPNKSKVWFEDSYIFPIEKFIDDAINATNRIDCIVFTKCRLETQTLLNVLGKMSSAAGILIKSCNVLLNFDLMHRKSSLSLRNLHFEDMCLDSKQLITLLNILDQNSVVNFSRCEITNQCTEQYNFNQESEITIGLINMSVDLQMFIFKQKNRTVLLKNCKLKFDTELIPNNLIESKIIFEQITFDSADHLKLFAKFSETSGIGFRNCGFDFTRLRLIPNIMIKPRWIYFRYQSFDLEVLVTILERISAETMASFSNCDVELVDEVFSIRPVKIKRTCFENMQLDVAIFLRIAKNFDSPCGIEFMNCKFVCTKPYELPNISLNLARVSFVDMEFDVTLFKIIVQKFSETVCVVVVNCNFISVPEEMLSDKSVDLGHIEFYNVDYSPGFLQCLQQLNDKCIVEYDGELTNRAFIDICSKTPVHGERLRLLSHVFTRSDYFEIFTELLSHSQDLDFETEYALPTHLIPYIESEEFRHFFDEFKVKLVSVNDVTLKLEFLRFGESIDLFYLLNDLSDDSDDEFIDHS